MPNADRVGLNGCRSQSQPPPGPRQRQEHPSLTFSRITRSVCFPPFVRLFVGSGNFHELCRVPTSRASLGSETVTSSCLMAELLVLFASSWAINVKTYGIMTLHCLPLPPLLCLSNFFLRCFVLCDEARCLSSRFLSSGRIAKWTHFYGARCCFFGTLGNCGRIIDIRQQLMNALQSLTWATCVMSLGRCQKKQRFSNSD